MPSVSFSRRLPGHPQGARGIRGENLVQPFVRILHDPSPSIQGERLRQSNGMSSMQRFVQTVVNLARSLVSTGCSFFFHAMSIPFALLYGVDFFPIECHNDPRVVTLIDMT